MNLPLKPVVPGIFKWKWMLQKLQPAFPESGSVKLRGQTKDFDIDLSGAGHAYCYDLLTENTTVEISGAGSAQVYASVKLKAE